MSWKCSCGVVNSGTNKHCAAISNYKAIEHNQVSENSPDWIMAFLAAKDLGMNAEEELFAKFYNEEKILVKDMDFIQLREHREELSKVAFEARARLTAADESIREKKAKSSSKEWLVSSTSQPGNESVTDAINVPKLRQARMSKADKLRKQLLDIGIDDDTVNTMIKNVESKATDSKLKAITFKADNEVVKIPLKTDTNGTTPFNPASLKFRCNKCGQNPCRCDGLLPVAKD